MAVIVTLLIIRYTQFGIPTFELSFLTFGWCWK